MRLQFACQGFAVFRPVLVAAFALLVWPIGARDGKAQTADVISWCISEDGVTAALALSSGEVHVGGLPAEEQGKRFQVAEAGDLGPLALSATGELAAVALRSRGTIGIWDCAIGMQRRTIAASDVPTALAIAPNGKWLAVAGQFQLAIFDLEQGRKLGELPNIHQCTSIGWSENSKLVGLVSEGRVKVWFPGSKKLLLDQPWPIGVGGEIQLAFAPDGKRLATRFRSDTVLWDVAQGKRLGEIRDGSDATPGLAFAAGGKQLVTCTETEFIFRDVSIKDGGTGDAGDRIEQRLPIDVRPDRVLFSRDGDKAVWMERFVRKPSGLKGHSFSAKEPDEPATPAGVGAVRSAWTPPNFDEARRKLAANPEVFRIDQRGQTPGEKPAKSARKPVPNAQAFGSSMAISGDGLTAAVGGTEGEVFVSDIKRSRLRTRFWASDSSRITRMAMSSDGKTIAICQGESQIDLWSDRGESLARLKLEEEPRLIRFSPSGSYLLVAVGNQLLQFDARSFQGIQSLQFENEVMALGIAADESLVAVGVVNTVYLWSATEDKLMWRVESGATGVTGLAISPGKTRVVVDYSSPVSEVYDLNAGRRLVLKDVMLEAPAFLDEDRIIGGDGTRALHVVSAQDLSVLETIPHPSGGVNIEAYSNELAFDSNGKVAVFRGSIRFPLSELRVWKR